MKEFLCGMNLNSRVSCEWPFGSLRRPESGKRVMHLQWELLSFTVDADTQPERTIDKSTQRVLSNGTKLGSFR